MPPRSSVTVAMFAGRNALADSHSASSDSDTEEHHGFEDDTEPYYRDFVPPTEQPRETDPLADQLDIQVTGGGPARIPSPSLAIQTEPESEPGSDTGLRHRVGKMRDTVNQRMFSDEDTELYAINKALFSSRRDMAKKIAVWFKWGCIYIFYFVLVLIGCFLLAPETKTQPWIKCLENSPRGLWTEAARVENMSMSATHYIPWCTTRLTKFALPCACCIGKNTCFSSVEVHEPSERMSTVTDELVSPDGTSIYEMKRRVPFGATVCTEKLDMRNQKIQPLECVEVEGAEISVFLRAEEMLKGTTFSGDIVHTRPLA